MYSRRNEGRGYRVPLQYSGTAFSEPVTQLEKRDAVGRPSAIEYNNYEDTVISEAIGTEEKSIKNKKISSPAQKLPKGELDFNHTHDLYTENDTDENYTAQTEKSENESEAKAFLGFDKLSFKSDDALLASLILLLFGKDSAVDTGTLMLLLILFML